MENKVLFDGQIVNEIKLSQYNTCLLRMQNKQEFTKKDGTQGSSSCTMVVTVRDKIAMMVSERFKRGDIVRVEGALQLKKTDKIDQEGKEVWEVRIRARTINAIGGVTQGKSIEQRSGFTQKPQRTANVPNQQVELEQNPNDQFGMDDELPF